MTGMFSCEWVFIQVVLFNSIRLQFEVQRFHISLQSTLVPDKVLQGSSGGECSSGTHHIPDTLSRKLYLLHRPGHVSNSIDLLFNDY